MATLEPSSLLPNQHYFVSPLIKVHTRVLYERQLAVTLPTGQKGPQAVMPALSGLDGLKVLLQILQARLNSAASHVSDHRQHGFT